MRKTNTKSLLELLARIRTIKALDRAAKIDRSEERRVGKEC